MLQESMSDDEEVPGEVDALRDFCSLRTRDTNNRLQFLDSVIGIVKDWTSQNQANGVQKRLEESLPCILRLSKRCPFPDVRDKCTEVLKIVKVCVLPHRARYIVSFWSTFFVAGIGNCYTETLK